MPKGSVPIKLKTLRLDINCFNLELMAGRSLYMYSINWPDLGDKKWTKHKREKAFSSLTSGTNPAFGANHQNMAWDNGGIVYASKLIPGIGQGEATFAVPSGHENHQEIKIQFQKELKYDVLMKYLSKTGEYLANKEDFIQALNVVIQKRARESLDTNREHVYTKTGDCSYFRTAQLDNKESDTYINEGVAAVRGFFASVRLAPARILLNVNTRTSPFYGSGKMKLHVEEFRQLRWSDAKMELYFKGLKVSTDYMTSPEGNPQRKVKTVKGFVWRDDKYQIPDRLKGKMKMPEKGSPLTSENAFFSMNGLVMSVAEHFRKSKC